jgi:phospholipase/carboxylesterase
MNREGQESRRGARITRRTFLGAGVLAALGAGAARVGGASVRPGDAREFVVTPAGDLRSVTGASPQDPRLTARPYPPFRTPEPGESRFGQQLERGGILYVPASYTPDVSAPLVVALHGSGGSAERWSGLYDACEERGIVLVAPESRGSTWDRVDGAFGPDVGFIDSALRYTFERCAPDAERIALAGFSDGASYALSLGPSNGDLFTHLIAWSPGFSNPTDPIVGSPRVFVSHGARDGVLPVNLTRGALVPMFEMDGYDVEYVEFEGDHELTPEIAERALDWFVG